MSGLLLYLIGQPGAGKSTLLAALLAGRTRTPVVEKGTCAHVLAEADACCPPGLPDVIVELGRDRDGFSGTDALPFNVLPAALALLETCQHPLVVAEGDRLAAASFLDGAAARGWDVRVVYLATDDEVAAARRTARGSTQNETWVRGRITKAERLAADRAIAVLDGSRSVADLAGDLRSLVAGWLP